MDDTLAKQLFAADGNPPEDWGVIDECVRMHYRLEATKHPKKWLVRPYEGDVWRVTDEPPTDETRRWLEYREVTASSPNEAFPETAPSSQSYQRS